MEQTNFAKGVGMLEEEFNLTGQQLVALMGSFYCATFEQLSDTKIGKESKLLKTIGLIAINDLPMMIETVKKREAKDEG